MIPEKLQTKALDVYAQTSSARIASKRTGLSLTTVYRILERHGIERVGTEAYRRHARKIHDPKRVVAEYENGDSLLEIARRLQCSQRTVTKALTKAGVKIRPRGNQGKNLTMAEAEEMARHYRELRSQTAVAALMGTNQSRVSTGLRMLGMQTDRVHLVRENHPTWKGGRIVTPDGYVRVLLRRDDPMHCMAGNGGYALEHRVQMARALGRPLHPNETVHHINGNPADNRISNLQLRFGRHGKGTAMVCGSCGSPDIRFAKLTEL